MNRLGKKGKQWEVARRNLKVRFERAGITRCEHCGRDNFLGFAHGKKRRNLAPEELEICALLCAECHAKIEIMPEAEMDRVIKSTIDARAVAI